MSREPRTERGADPAAEKRAHEDDVVVVPKGSRKTLFLLTALLAMLVLTTFTVPGEVIDVFTGRTRSKAWMSWKHPSQGAK